MRPPDEGHIDPRIFEALIEEHADRVYGIALRIVGSPEEAEDATQDTFLSAYLHRDTFRGASSPATWLCSIAVNAALQRLRRGRPVEYLEETGYESLGVSDWSVDVLREVERGELRETIERGILQLPEDARVALVLRDVEGFSTSEAADILELSEPALKSRLHRARVLLRHYLSDYVETR